METGLLSGYLRAGLYRRMGRTARQMGEYDLARQYYTAALRILGEPDTPETYTEMARTLNELAFLNFQQGRPEEALKTCEASMVYAQRASDLNALATAENTLGGIYFGQTGVDRGRTSHAAGDGVAGADGLHVGCGVDVEQLGAVGGPGRGVAQGQVFLRAQSGDAPGDGGCRRCDAGAQQPRHVEPRSGASGRRRKAFPRKPGRCATIRP